MSTIYAKYDAGQRVASRTGAWVFDVVFAQRGATPLMWKQWQTTDAEELRGDAETGRPRVKFVDIAEILANCFGDFALTPSLVVETSTI
ncbi:hypothetical protein [Mycobacterium sp.]|uniref:hypothetical protein n=1 Tax=Mycobacterium sp. TaxID=1785 RepID=UPI003BB659A8